MTAQLRKVLIIELLLFAFFFIQLFFPIKEIIYIAELAVIYLVLWKLLKVDKRDSRFQKDFILLILIGVIAYYIVVYFLGFFLGFVYSTYSRRLLGITRNIVICILEIIFIESIREKIVKSGRYYKSILVIAILLFTTMEISGLYNLGTLEATRDIVEFILSIIIPNLVKNVMLTFLCLYSNKKLTILYQLLMRVPLYILGIFPNIGDYLNSVFYTMLPLLLVYAILKFTFLKKDKIENGRIIETQRKINRIIYLTTIMIVAILVYLVSGYGRFQIMSIATASMTGTINKGDAVIVDSKDRNFKVGKVIAFYREGKVIVHRLVKIKEKDAEYIYITKGDYNDSEDVWKLKDKDIIGCVNFKIPYIGWPSVSLSEILNRK